jgi:hypothetical protein
MPGFVGARRLIAVAGQRRGLVLVREKEFKDCVRGEQLSYWGGGEAVKLGIAELLRNA